MTLFSEQERERAYSTTCRLADIIIRVCVCACALFINKSDSCKWEYGWSGGTSISLLLFINGRNARALLGAGSNKIFWPPAVISIIKKKIITMMSARTYTKERRAQHLKNWKKEQRDTKRALLPNIKLRWGQTTKNALDFFGYERGEII